MIKVLTQIQAFKLFLATMLLLSTIYLYAQDPVYRTINNLNGLPSNTIYNIHQDKQGFIWIAHDKGLTRYDGKLFKNYYAPTQQGKSLSNLTELNNAIWCQDFAGNFYYTQNDSLKRETRLNGFGAYIPASILNNNTIAVPTYNGVFSINTTTNKSSIIVQKNEGVSASFSNNKTLVYTAANKLFEYNGSSIQLMYNLPRTTPVFYFLQQVKQNYFGLTKEHYPYVYKISNTSFTPVNILQPGLFIQDVITINHEIWVSTSTGVYCFDDNWQPKYNGFCFFKGTSISKVIKDREDNYWFCTLNKGIIIVPEIDTRLYKSKDEIITSLATDDENIITGTANNNIIYFDEQKCAFSKQYKGVSNSEIVNIFYDKLKQQTLFSSNQIYSLNNNGKVNVFANNAGKCIVALDTHFYVLAFSGGISLIRRDNTNTPVPQWLQNTDWVNNHYPLLNFGTRGRWVLYDSKDSVLYAATSSGLYFFSPKAKGKIEIDKKDIYASQLVLANNGIYAATFSDGLIFINNAHQAFAIKNVNISKTIYKIKKSGNNLWMITDNGLQKYDITANTIVNYTYADGLPKAEFKDLEIKENKIFLATSEGLVVFNDNLNNLNETTPKLVINSVLVNNQQVNLSKSNSFNSEQNNIEINFSFLSFRNSDNAEKIQYKINDGNWQTLASASRTLSLPSLASGKYNLLIRAYNEDGVSTDGNVELNFIIQAPFYKQLWFIGIVVLAVLASLFYFFSIRLKNIKQKNLLLSQKMKLEQDLQQSMLSSIKSQMNPHFLFNALNTIQSYIYTNDKENASQYLGKFSQLTRMILDMSNKDIVAVAEEIKALNLYLELEQLRFEDKLQYQFNIDENISIETAYIPSMLVQPYVENAIKHGLLHKKDNWQLTLSFTKQGNGIFVLVDDNGIGRKRSNELNRTKAKHQSFATAANQKRLEILNRDAKQNIGIEVIDKIDADGNPQGTTIKLFIPFAKSKT